MTAPLVFCKGGVRLIVCAQDRGTYVALGLLGGAIGILLDPAESDEIEAMLAAARRERQSRPIEKDQAA